MGAGGSINADPLELLEPKLPEETRKSMNLSMQMGRLGSHMNHNVVVGELDRDVHEFYAVSNKEALGKGMNGSVRLCTHRETNVQYALKTLVKGMLIESQLEELRNEIRIMAELDHPNIIRVQEYFETAENIYIIMELCTGGDLLTRINKLDNFHFTEAKAAELMLIIVSSVRFLHDRGIVHRDIKLNNFLLQNKSENSPIKVIDFGFSRHVKPDEVMKADVGTPYYMAPEVLNCKYDMKCDMWSIGVVAYMLLTGNPPFDGRTNDEIYENIRYGEVDYRIPEMRFVSNHAKDFIKCCLNRNVSSRISSREAQEHPWLQTVHNVGSTPSSSSLLTTNIHLPRSQIPILDRLRTFGFKNPLTKVCLEVVSYSLTADQIKNLREEFLKFDTDGSGEISLAEMKAVLRTNKDISVEAIEELFDSLDVEHDGTLRYHEFIAAAIGLKNVNESNMKLAFEKISHHRKEIKKEDLVELLGCDARPKDIDDMLLSAGLNKDANITYDVFKNIMTQEPQKQTDQETTATTSPPTTTMKSFASVTSVVIQKKHILAKAHAMKIDYSSYPKVISGGMTWIKLYDSGENTDYWYCEELQTSQWEEPVSDPDITSSVDDMAIVH